MAKMKGLLKGLRQISNIFEAADKEPEMQIGNPTDVKHVAHIGWDGPSSENSPAWMNDLRSTTSATPVIGTINGSGNGVAISPQLTSRDTVPTTDHPPTPSSSKELPAVPLPTPKPSRRSASTTTTTATTSHSSDAAAEGTRKGSRRGRRTGDQGSASRGTSESVSSSSSSSSSTILQDAPGALPKQTRPRRAKDTSEGSIRSSRSKGAVTSDQGSEKLTVSPLKPVEEEK